tara:strand:+ start:8163 stop:9530 length:1368 start_codon:yes stop_codon:yes gene_type:complete
MKRTSTLYRTALATIGLCAALSTTSAKDAATDPIRVDARLDRPVIYANQPGKVVVQISLQPDEIVSEGDRQPVNLALVLDRSGSMRGDKIRSAIEAARLAVGQLGPNDVISVVIYDNEIDTIAPAGRAEAEYRDSIRRALAGVTPRGNTAIYGGLTQAAAELRKFAREGYVNRMILLSDGLANQGPSSPSDFERLARAFAGEDFIVSTVGLGMDFNEDIMTSLASAGQGNTYFVETAADLPRIFQRELGDVLSVAATDIEITIEGREGIRIVKGIGREADLESETVARLRIPQVYGGLDKLALLELEVPAGKEGERRELVDVEVSYRLTKGGAVKRQQVVVPVIYSGVQEEVVQAVQSEVVINVAQNRIAETKTEAILLADEGNIAASGEVLRKVSDDLAADYDGYEMDAVLEAEAKPLEEDARDIQTSGMSNKKRKQMRSESYQTVNQQAVSAK